jgi:hypothetical protein
MLLRLLFLRWRCLLSILLLLVLVVVDLLVVLVVVLVGTVHLFLVSHLVVVRLLSLRFRFSH